MKLHKRKFEINDLETLGENVEGIEHQTNKEREYFPSWTWLDSNGLKLTCAGFIPIWPGLAEVWSAVSIHIKDHPLKRQLIRDIKNQHVKLSLAFDIRRGQSIVNAEFRDGHAMAKLLGYKFESAMPDFGPNGETYYRYVWLARDHIK